MHFLWAFTTAPTGTPNFCSITSVAIEKCPPPPSNDHENTIQKLMAIEKRSRSLVPMRNWIIYGQYMTWFLDNGHMFLKWPSIQTVKTFSHDFPLNIKRNFNALSNRYNQAPHLTQDTNGKLTTSQLDFTNESQEISPFPAGDHKTSINRRTWKHNKNKTEIT